MWTASRPRLDYTRFYDAMPSMPITNCTHRTVHLYWRSTPCIQTCDCTKAGLSVSVCASRTTGFFRPCAPTRIGCVSACLAHGPRQAHARANSGLVISKRTNRDSASQYAARASSGRRAKSAALASAITSADMRLTSVCCGSGCPRKTREHQHPSEPRRACRSLCAP